jgi:serine/threonine protein kinase
MNTKNNEIGYEYEEDGKYNAVKRETLDGKDYIIKKTYNYREAVLCNSIQHPNILNIKGIRNASKPNKLDIITEMIFELKQGDMTGYPYDLFVTNTSLFLKQILSALYYLHSRDIFHSDIKPKNILYDETMTHFYLCDFGLTQVFNYTNQKQDYLCTENVKAPCIVESACCNIDLFSLAVTTIHLLQQSENKGLISNIGSVQNYISSVISPLGFDLLYKMMGGNGKFYTAYEALEHEFLKEQNKMVMGVNIVTDEDYNLNYTGAIEKLGEFNSRHDEIYVNEARKYYRNIVLSDKVTPINEAQIKKIINIWSLKLMPIPEESLILFVELYNRHHVLKYPPLQTTEGLLGLIMLVGSMYTSKEYGDILAANYGCNVNDIYKHEKEIVVNVCEYQIPIVPYYIFIDTTTSSSIVKFLLLYYVFFVPSVTTTLLYDLSVNLTRLTENFIRNGYSIQTEEIKEEDAIMLYYQMEMAFIYLSSNEVREKEEGGFEMFKEFVFNYY